MFFSGKDHEVKWSVQDVVSRRDTLRQIFIRSNLSLRLIYPPNINN